MKINRVETGLRRWATGGVALWLMAASVCGQTISPLYVGNVNPLRDEYGRLMRGSSLEAEAAGRSLIEIRVANTNGGFQVIPPGKQGQASPYNPLVAANIQVGMGQHAIAPDRGVFCAMYPTRLPTGTKIFARAFNAPTLEGATFFADSAVVQVKGTDSALEFAFGMLRALDDGDDDGDGLNNSWERSMGSFDLMLADSDGDGMSDLHEMLAGTSSTNASSRLEMSSIRSEKATGAMAKSNGKSGFEMIVKWQSVPGKTYQIQHVPMLGVLDPETGEEYVFEMVGEHYTAGEGEYEMSVRVEDIPEEATTGVFRVKLVLPE